QTEAVRLAEKNFQPGRSLDMTQLCGREGWPAITSEVQASGMHLTHFCAYCYKARPLPSSSPTEPRPRGTATHGRVFDRWTGAHILAGSGAIGEARRGGARTVGPSHRLVCGRPTPSLALSLRLAASRRLLAD